MNDWHHPLRYWASVPFLCSLTLWKPLPVFPFWNAYLNISTSPLSLRWPNPKSTQVPFLSRVPKSWTRLQKRDLICSLQLLFMYFWKSRFSYFLNEATWHMWNNSRCVWQISLGATWWVDTNVRTSDIHGCLRSKRGVWLVHRQQPT